MVNGTGWHTAISAGAIVGILVGVKMVESASCCHGYSSAIRARISYMMKRYPGRGVYLVADAGGHLHAFLAPHKPATEVLAIVGEEEDGSAAVVWMQEWRA